MLAPFVERHRDVAERETALLKILPGHPVLPEEEYWFIEWYCVDPACDCRRVRVAIAPRANPTNTLAAIAWGWDSREFYRKWMDDEAYAQETVEGNLEPMMPQSRHAEEFLRIFQERIATEPGFGRQFSEHYALFKRGIIAETVLKADPTMTRQQRRQAERAIRKGGLKSNRPSD